MTDFLTKRGKGVLGYNDKNSVLEKCKKQVNVSKLHKMVKLFLTKNLKNTLVTIKKNTITNSNIKKGGFMQPWCAGTTQCIPSNELATCDNCASSCADSAPLPSSGASPGAPYVTTPNMQMGGRISMPIEFFGGDSGRYFEDGSPEIAAHGNSFGAVTYNDNTMSPNLSPHIGGEGVTGIMTGGANKSKKNMNKNKKGGRIAMPLEYFGGVSGRYFEDGSPELDAHGNSFGAVVDGMKNMMSPGLMPHIAGNGVTGIMTGGVDTNIFSNMKSIFNKKVFNKNIKDILKKLDKNDVKITEEAQDKLRFMTEIYVMKKLLC